MSPGDRLFVSTSGSGGGEAGAAGHVAETVAAPDGPAHERLPERRSPGRT